MSKRVAVWSSSLIILFSSLFYFFSGSDLLTVKDDMQSEDNSKHFKILGISTESLLYKAERDIKIAIVDSGINKSHPDLNLYSGNSINFVDENMSIKDDFNHGTAVAGIISAQNNDFGIVGVANKSEIFDLKVLNNEGKGEVKDLINALEWCIENQIDIINISFGFQSSNEELHKVIKKAYERNIVIVASAGNTYGLGVDYPARYNEVISVNSINENNQLLNSSAYGKIDFVAPGLNILSTDNQGDYSYFTGTSFSSAYVTGIIANLMSRNLISSENVMADLKRHTQDIYELDYDNYSGFGILKLEKNN